MNTTSTALLPEFGFLATLVFGFWLSRKGRPYNGALFNVHKLIALGTVIITAVQVYEMMKTLEPSALIIPWLIFASISVLVLFASGAFMSIGNKNYDVLKTMHNIAPVVVVVTIGIAIFFLVEQFL